MPGESFCHLSKITMVYIYKVLTFVVMKISVSENNKRPRTTLIMNIIIWTKQVWGVALQYTLLGGGSKGMLLHNLKFEVLWNVISGIQGCMWVTFFFYPATDVCSFCHLLASDDNLRSHTLIAFNGGKETWTVSRSIYIKDASLRVNNMTDLQAPIALQ